MPLHQYSLVHFWHVVNGHFPCYGTLMYWMGIIMPFLLDDTKYNLVHDRVGMSEDNTADIGACGK